MDDIPTDVLLNIFRECLSDPDEPYPSVESTSQPPLLFTAVNKRWREVAYGSATLWTRFHVDLEANWDDPLITRSKPYRERIRVRGEKIKQWLKRCAGASISLSLRIESYDGVRMKAPEEVLMPIVNTICSYSGQWERLVLFKVDEPYRSRILSIPPENLPRLFHVGFPIYSGADGTGYTDNDSAVALQDSGILKGPMLSAITLQRLPPLEGIPRETWQKVRELELFCSCSLPESVLPTKAEMLLRQCPNLTRLSLRIPANPFFRLESKSPIVLPRLRYLDLHEVHLPFSTGPLLSILRLPSLSELVFRITHLRNCVLYQTSLVTLFQANEFTICQTLTHLSFEYASFSPGGLRYLFSLVPQITNLKLLPRTMDFYPETFQGYVGLEDFHELIPKPAHTIAPTEKDKALCTVTEKVTCLLPNLQHLHCRLCFDGELNDGQLVEFIERRLMYAGRSSSIPGHVLPRLKSVYMGFVSPKVVDVEQALLERGVDMRGFYVKAEHGLKTMCRFL